MASSFKKPKDNQSQPTNQTLSYNKSGDFLSLLLQFPVCVLSLEAPNHILFGSIPFE